MSKFKNTHIRRQKELRAQYPDLKMLEEVKETSSYSFVAVSLFDHWLSELEASQLLGNLISDELVRRNSLFTNLNRIIIEQTEVLNFVRRGNYRNYYNFRHFSSDEVRNIYLEHRSHGNYQLVIPEFSLVYFEGYDDTNIFYLRDSSQRSIVEDWASEAGLYTLDQPNKMHNETVEKRKLSE